MQVRSLRVVDENVRSVDGVDLPHQILVHAIAGEPVTGLLGILVPDVTELSCPQAPMTSSGNGSTSTKNRLWQFGDLPSKARPPFSAVMPSQ